jgi:hypothetical protein
MHTTRQHGTRQQQSLSGGGHSAEQHPSCPASGPRPTSMGAAVARCKETECGCHDQQTRSSTWTDPGRGSRASTRPLSTSLLARPGRSYHRSAISTELHRQHLLPMYHVWTSGMYTCTLHASEYPWDFSIWTLWSTQLCFRFLTNRRTINATECENTVPKTNKKAKR